jgi:hypothetical protein
MSDPRGLFQSIYESPWAATALLAAVNLGGLALWLRRRSFLFAYLVVFTLIALADALQSGAWSPLQVLAPPAKDRVAFFFVLAGDFRYFLLVERFASSSSIGAKAPTPWRAWVTAMALTAVVPLLVGGLTKAWPARFTGRWQYLAWEALFVVFALALRAAVLPRRLARASAEVRSWLLATTTFQIVQYALWATADVGILAGIDAGFALRIVPNILYYGVFLWFVALRAPAEVSE